MYRHILFPTDGSASSQAALATTRALALAYGSRVTVLYALQLPMQSGALLGLSPGQLFNARELSRMFEERGQALLGQASAELTGLKVETRLSHADPREAILAAVAERDCDLLVMGTRQHQALHRALLGSVSSYLTQHSPIPLLLVPAQIQE